MLKNVNFKNGIKNQYGHVLKYKKRFIDYYYPYLNRNILETAFIYCYNCSTCNIEARLILLKQSSKKAKSKKQLYWIDSNFITCNEMIIKKFIE